MGAKLLDEQVTGVRTFLPAYKHSLTLTVQLPAQITSHQLTPVSHAVAPVQSDSVVFILNIVTIVIWICVATQVFSWCIGLFIYLNKKKNFFAVDSQ